MARAEPVWVLLTAFAAVFLSTAAALAQEPTRGLARQSLLTLAPLASDAGAAPPAATPDRDLIEQLLARIETLEQRLQKLEPPDQAAKPTSEKPHTGPPGEATTHEGDHSKWTEVGRDLRLFAHWSNGFVAETADKSFHIHLGGRLEWDNSWFTQDDNILIGSSADTRLRDGTVIRRARFRTDGRLWELVDFVAEVNFANIQDVSNVESEPVRVGSVGLTNFHVTFREVPLAGNIRVGHFKAPVGLERLSSSNDLYYMERSSLFDAFLGPNNFQSGVLVFDAFADDRITLAGAFTWIGKATVQSFGFGNNEGKYAVSGRATALPVYEDDGRLLLHVGVGYQHQTLVNHQFIVANRPLLRSGAGSDQIPDLLETGTFFTPNGADILDLEAAFVAGPFSMSAEYALARVEETFDSFNGAVFAGPRGDAVFQAAYAEAGLFVTPGDYRRYDRKSGTWGRTVPVENAFITRGEERRWCWGHGALQLVARYTYLDLVTGSPVLTPASGGARAGREHDVTLGMIWYLNPQTSFMVNYIWTRLDSVVAGASGDLHGIGCRVHLDF